MGWEKLSISFEKSLEVASQTSEVAHQSGSGLFALIVSIVAILLVTVLCLATFYYGGCAYDQDGNLVKKKTLIKKSKLDFSPR